MPGCQPDAPCHHTWPWLALSRCPLFLLSLLASTATAARTVGNGVQDACSKFPKIRVDDCRSCRRAKRRRRAGWPTILEYRGVHVAVLARIAAQVFDVLLSRTVRKVLNVLQARIHSTPSQDIIPHANSNSKDITSSTEKRTSDFQKDISDTISRKRL